MRVSSRERNRRVVAGAKFGGIELIATLYGWKIFLITSLVTLVRNNPVLGGRGYCLALIVKRKI
jgi:hypothetical protein